MVSQFTAASNFVQEEPMRSRPEQKTTPAILGMAGVAAVNQVAPPSGGPT
jgi:hypothetical protein